MPWFFRLVCFGREPVRNAQEIGRRLLVISSALMMGIESATAAPPQSQRRPSPTIRQILSDEALPIPLPKPIVMDESWLRSDSQETNSEQTVRKASFDQSPGPMQSGPPPPETPQQKSQASQVSQQSSENKLPELEIPLGEYFNLRAFEQIGQISQVFVNRDEIVLVEEAKDGKFSKLKDGKFSKPVDSIQVRGRKLGLVEMTLIGERGVKEYRIRITPSVLLIEALIARQFPMSSVEVTAAGDSTLVLDGSVESPGDVDGILQLVQSFVGAKGKVVNGIKVSGVMQVQLEVVIARVDRAELRRLGLNFEYAGKGGYAGSTIGNIGGITPIASSVANNAATAGGNAFQSVGGAAASVVTPASTVFFGATHELQQFMAQIEALQQQGVAKVLAKPILTTLNGRPAEFLVGGEQPYPYQTSALTSPSVDFKKFGTRLNFVPVILSPDKIRLDLVPEHSSVNFTQSLVVGGNQIPQFITQRIHTTVEMEPGQTLVLGGLLQTESDAQVEKVPILGDLPLVGAAFRRVRHQERELELIIIVTPRLVHPMPESDCPLPLPGDESRRPTDKELYWHGLPEAPHEVPEVGGSAFHPVPYESASTGSRKASASGKAVVQQVAENKAERNSKSWVKLPSLYRKQQQPTRTRTAN